MSMYKDLTFNAIKQKIHLKPCLMVVKRKDKDDYKKEWDLKKLTFYKDYKRKMIWFNTYGIDFENVNFTEIREDYLYQIETDKTIINITLKEVEDDI